MKLSRAALALILVSSSFGLSQNASRRGPPPVTGGIEGRTVFQGPDPDAVLPMEAQPACVALHEGPVLSERIVRDPEGRLANVLVVLEGDGLAAAANPPPTPVLTQQGCRYRPRVVALQAGQELVIRNGDPMLHNVHCRPELNARFNIGQPFQGAESRRVFSEPELGIQVRCDIHPWMIAFVHVLAHPYFQVTGPDGRFEWPGLSPGDYTLRLRHEELGEKTESVRVEAGGSVEVIIQY